MILHTTISMLINTITPHQWTLPHLILFPYYIIWYSHHSIALSCDLRVSQLLCLSITLLPSMLSVEPFLSHLATIPASCDVTVSPPLVRGSVRTSIGLVLATVLDCRFKSGSRSKLNDCQRSCPDRHFTRTVNWNMIRCKSPSQSELGWLSADCPAGLSTDSDNSLAFAGWYQYFGNIG